ncbi:MAG: hypothetical protein AB7L13_12205 [Acidimicrobiia bacterium]
MQRERGRLRAVVLVLSLLVPVLLVACGDDSGDSGGGSASPSGSVDTPAAEPAPDVSVFRTGLFAGIPVPRGATELSAPSQTNGAITATYGAAATSPARILDIYRRLLPADGWTSVVPVDETGKDIYRGDWMKDGRRLQVVSSPAPGVGDERTQFSLLLLPTSAAPNVSAAESAGAGMIGVTSS